MLRTQLTAVNHYDVFPFNHGGSLGIRGLYKALSEWFDINIITFVTHDYFPDEIYISDHVKVIPIVLPEKLIQMQYAMYEEYGMNEHTIVDSSLAVVRWYHEFPEVINRVKEIAQKSFIVLAEHVFTWRIIKKACPDKHLWYRANNVEYDYKLTTWNKIGCPKDLLKEVYDIEKECCEECEYVLTVSNLEKKRFIELYNLPGKMHEKFINIRSGYDIDNLHTIIPSKRDSISDNYQYSGLFIASDTPSTRKAAENCIMVAKECPDIQIVLLGGVGKAFKEIPLPKNIVITGIVTDEEKTYYLQHCDFALNLLEAGAGINVKMFEYFAFGIPVITTKYGARGIELINNRDCIITEYGNFSDDIRAFCELSLQKRDNIANCALNLLIEQYSWRSLAKKIVEKIENWYHVAIFERAIPLDEIELYKFKESESYLPSKPVYIRCAGEWGQKCLAFLHDKGIFPKAFVDEDVKKQQQLIGGIPVIPVKQYLKERNNSEIVVAVGQIVEFAADLVVLGVSVKDISIAWDGRQIMKLSDLSGCHPYYYDPHKWKKEIIKKAEKTLEHKITEKG